MTLSRMKGENLQSIFDETYDNYLDDVYRGKERPKAQAGETKFFSFRSIIFFFCSSREWFLYSPGNSSWSGVFHQFRFMVTWMYFIRNVCW